MPDQPSWIQRVPEILQVLEAAGFPALLDRPMVEALFGVRRRQAIYLLNRFGGYQVGRAYLVPRESLVRYLREPRRLAASAHEKGRFERLRSSLGEARRQLPQRRIVIPAPVETDRMGLSGLPAGIQLEAHQLTIQFATPVDLLSKLFALSQALSNDYQTFERSSAGVMRAAGG